VRVLLTGAGVDTPGLVAARRALDRLTDEVVVVAPEEDRPSVGRTTTEGFGVAEHEFGYAVEGTPADAVHFAETVLENGFGLVVSGVAGEPTIGTHRLGRSGVVGAAVEAAHLGYPAVALSVYDPAVGVRPFEQTAFSPVEAVLETLLGAVGPPFPEGCDYLNVNLPADETAPLRATEPVEDFALDIDRRPDGYHAVDRFHDPLAANEVTDPVGTDRRAVADGEVSVSPLAVGVSVPALEAVQTVLPDRTG
jgi:5'-nucleotidase